MLLPPLCTQADYVNAAKEAGLSVFGEPKDISDDVKATWSVGTGATAAGRESAHVLTRSNASQGHLVVTRAEPIALGICSQSGP